MGDICSLDIKHVSKKSKSWRGLRYSYGLKERAHANHMMQLFITRLRHRLAVCEVEQGEWGRQLPAAKMPVGRAREEQVRDREAILV